MVEKERKYMHLPTTKNQNLKENGNGNVVKDCWNNKKKETMEETNENGRNHGKKKLWKKLWNHSLKD